MNLLALCAAAVVATPVVIMARNFLKVRRWQRVPGVVLSTGMRQMNFPRSPARSHRPVIRYSYLVDCTEHLGSVYLHGAHVGGSKRWAQRILDRYPQGTSITVRHDPALPSRCCITVEFGFFGWVLTVLSLLLFILAACL
ncbi:DUF3592 domain-containing protein [Verrucomicrobium sp. BvORR106]|uniref:DUF3592 domain-containing protein n=1 Tax=Verrucomicrobium sp. BvORR106 TaxID=1403819 RepID=UPI00056EB256|nr:DUF3592 domain-containing protein [Verrucomicrobium sp. BvORR106]